MSVGGWLLSIVGAVGASAAMAQTVLLPAELAFQVLARVVRPDRVEFTYRVAPGYRLHPEGLTAHSDSDSVRVLRTEILGGAEENGQGAEVVFRVWLSGASAGRIVAEARGCANAAGVCYAPITSAVEVGRESLGAWAPCKSAMFRSLAAMVGLCAAL